MTKRMIYYLFIAKIPRQRVVWRLWGDIIVDFSKDKQVVGIEIMNASELLKPYDITKSMLSQAFAGDIKVLQRRNMLFVTDTVYLTNDLYISS